MKVFIGWSGGLSKSVATELRSWLRKVIQAVDPFMSEEDIAKGARWSPAIAAELEAARFGVFCITRENVRSPWVNFETGAVSKIVKEANVCPLLIDLPQSEVVSPLNQFQTASLDEKEMRRLVLDISRASSPPLLDEGTVLDSFAIRWPAFNSVMQALPSGGGIVPHRTEREILEEILELTRAHARVAQSMEAKLTEMSQLSFLTLEGGNRTEMVPPKVPGGDLITVTRRRHRGIIGPSGYNVLPNTRSTEEDPKPGNE